MNKLIAIDAETGGLDPRSSPILSLAAVAWDGSSFEQKIRPRRVWWRGWRRMLVDHEAAVINGYTPEGWEAAGAVEVEEAAERFYLWLRQKKKDAGGPVTMVAHNAGFDRGFLEEMQRVTGVHFGLAWRWECSQAALAFLRRAGVFSAGSCSLNALAELTFTPRAEVHDALEDARVCLQGYQFLLMAVGAKKERGAVR